VEVGSRGVVAGPAVEVPADSPIVVDAESLAIEADWAVERSEPDGTDPTLSSTGLVGETIVSRDVLSVPLGTPVAVAEPVGAVTADAVPVVSSTPLLPPPQAPRAELSPTM
jgi:hypothetical protein